MANNSSDQPQIDFTSPQYSMALELIPEEHHSIIKRIATTAYAEGEYDAALESLKQSIRS